MAEKKFEPTEQQFEQIFGSDEESENDERENEENECFQDFNDCGSDSAIYINMYAGKEILTKKEVIKQVAIWMNSIMLNEHV